MTLAEKVAKRYVMSVTQTAPGKLKGLLPGEVVKPLAELEVWVQSMAEMLPFSSGAVMFGDNPVGKNAKDTIYGARRALGKLNTFIDALAGEKKEKK